MLKYIQASFIDEKLYQDISTLECICMESEKLFFKLELSYKHEKWLASKHKNVNELQNEFLCYEGETLVGYVGISQFGALDSIPELMGMVHPKYVRKKIFSTLLNEAVKECKSRTNQKIYFLCNRDSKSGIAFLKQYKASYEYSEYQMEYHETSRKNAKEEQKEFALELATNKDIPQLIDLEEELYGKEISESEYPKPEEESKQDFYIYIAKVKQKVVGKVALQFEQDAKGKKCVGIYGVGIYKREQGRGYGKKLLEEAVKIAQENGRNHIFLQVDSTNEIAHKMYQKFGFQELYTMNYYTCDMSKKDSISNKIWSMWNELGGAYDTSSPI